MRRPRSHEIDEAAGRIFINALPLGWTHNEHKHDYGKDYLVEVGKNREMTGTSCFVQQKGQDKVVIRSKKGHVQFSLKRKHAIYYLDKVTDLPVFLVLIDVKTKCGWWLFLQPYLRNDQSWRKRQSVLVRIPLSNRIDNTNALTDAIQQANKTMRGMHPTAIQDAVAFAKEDMERLDPRLEVSVDVKDGKVMHHISAKEPVTLKVTFQASTPEHLEKIANLERGQLVAFDVGEVVFKGSPLFDRTATDAFTLQARVNWPSTLNIIVLGSDGQRLGEINDLAGSLVGGPKEVRYHAEIGDGLFTIDVGPYGELPEGAQRHFRFNCKFGDWDGQAISKLQWFNKLAPFLTTIEHAESLSVDFYKDGIFITRERVPVRGSVPRGVSSFFQGIKKARELFAHLRLDPLWTAEAYGKTIIGDIEQLHDIYLKGRHETPVLQFGATITASREGNENSTKGEYAQICDTIDASYNVLGVEIAVTLRRTITALRSETIDDPQSPNIQLKVKAVSETRMILEPLCKSNDKES